MYDQQRLETLTRFLKQVRWHTILLTLRSAVPYHHVAKIYKWNYLWMYLWLNPAPTIQNIAIVIVLYKHFSFLNSKLYLNVWNWWLTTKRVLEEVYEKNDSAIFACQWMVAHSPFIPFLNFILSYSVVINFYTQNR